MSKFRREEGGGHWRDVLRYKHRTSRGKDLAMAEEQVVMGTTHGTPSETTPASAPGTFPYTFWTLEHEMQCTHYTILWKHVLVWKGGEGHEKMHARVCTCSHSHTHSHHVFIVPKAKKGGGEGPFEPRTKKVFNTMSYTWEFNESQIPVGVFPSIFQCVLSCKYLYSDDNVTFVGQPHWLPHEELYFESEDIC